MIFSPRFSITNSITAALTKIERARGFLEAAKLSKNWISEMQNRALVLEGVHGVEPQPVEMVIAQPHQRVAHDEGAHLVGARLVQVDGRAPGRRVDLGEVRPEGGEPVAGGVELRSEYPAAALGQPGVGSGLHGCDGVSPAGQCAGTGRPW